MLKCDNYLPDFLVLTSSFMGPHIMQIKVHKIIIVWRSWDRASWYISIVKPSRCTVFEFIEYHSACFGRSFRPSSGVLDCTHSIRCMSYRLVDCLLAVTRWNWFHLVPAIWHIPDAVCTVLNSWWWTEIPSETRRAMFNKLENCAFCWFYYRNYNCLFLSYGC